MTHKGIFIVNVEKVRQDGVNELVKLTISLTFMLHVLYSKGNRKKSMRQKQANMVDDTAEECAKSEGSARELMSGFLNLCDK